MPGTKPSLKRMPSVASQHSSGLDASQHLGSVEDIPEREELSAEDTELEEQQLVQKMQQDLFSRAKNYVGNTVRLKQGNLTFERAKYKEYVQE